MIRPLLYVLCCGVACASGCDVQRGKAPDATQGAPRDARPARRSSLLAAPTSPLVPVAVGLRSNDLARVAAPAAPASQGSGEEAFLRIGDEGIEIPGLLRIDERGVFFGNGLSISDGGVEIPGVLRIDERGVVLFKAPGVERPARGEELLPGHLRRREKAPRVY
ncbi:MAG: hypothetical protein D6731_07520 [Planctomycetota bacterium]|nr:MAG: hypothetical protein D6731_07520 [Planctomycetota bacterium]